MRAPALGHFELFDDVVEFLEVRGAQQQLEGVVERAAENGGAQPVLVAALRLHETQLVVGQTGPRLARLGSAELLGGLQQQRHPVVQSFRTANVDASTLVQHYFLVTGRLVSKIFPKIMSHGPNVGR